MVTELHWIVTEMYESFIRLNGDWNVTDWYILVFMEWWRFVLGVSLVNIYQPVENSCFTAAVVQSVRVLALQSEGWVFEYQPRQT